MDSLRKAIDCALETCYNHDNSFIRVPYGAPEFSGYKVSINTSVLIGTFLFFWFLPGTG